MLPSGTVVKNPQVNAEDARVQFPSLSQEYSLEQEMATRSSILAWKIPWAEEPGRLQSLGSRRVGHDGAHAHIRYWCSDLSELIKV